MEAAHPSYGPRKSATADVDVPHQPIPAFLQGRDEGTHGTLVPFDLVSCVDIRRLNA
jgi:hypothetical protein